MRAYIHQVDIVKQRKLKGGFQTAAFFLLKDRGFEARENFTTHIYIYMKAKKELELLE